MNEFSTRLLDTLKGEEDLLTIGVIISRVVHGCEHSKGDQENAPKSYNHSSFGQTPKSYRKMLFEINIFMMTSNVVLSAQM